MKQDWQIKKLGDLYPLKTGKTPSRGDNSLWDTKKVSNNLWVSIADISANEGKAIIDTKEYISDKACDKFPLVPEGALLISFKLSLGRMSFAGRALRTNEAILSLVPIPEINHRFLYYYFLYFDWDKAAEGDVKVKGKTLNQKKLAEIPILYPSLSEQQRIVALLDAEFAKIDALKANAEKNLQNAKDLFISTLSKELKHREGWKETKIGEFCEIIRGKRFVRADIVEEGVPCIHYGDIYTHYGLFATKAKGCVSPVLAKKLRFANKNDVIVVAAGENRFDIGVGVAWLGDEPAVVHDACFILKHSQNPMFLSFYLRSAEYHQYLKDEVNEGKICSFLTKPLAEAKISLPSLEEQEQIVKRLEIVSTNCKAIQENYKKTLSLCDDLKQALLRKAFNGEI